MFKEFPALPPAQPVAVYDESVTTQQYRQSPHQVVVTDINMPFGSMVQFMIKWAIAAIPAAIILSVIFFLITALGWGALIALFGASGFGR
jgi:hypothetical protein